MPIYTYIDGRSFVHRLNPAVKVIGLFVVFWSVYWVDNPLALLPLGLFMLWIARVTGAWPNFHTLRWFFAILVLTTTIAWMFFNRQAPRVPHLPFLHFNLASVIFGLGRGIKLAELLGASVLFLSTTKVEEFTIGLLKLGVPYRVSFAISLAFRLAPLFMDSAVTVVDAQRLRGYDFDAGGVFERMRRYVTVAVPVFMAALRKANNMAMALEARGFGRLQQPTTYIDYPMATSDVLALALLGGLAAAHFMLYYTGIGAVSLT
jgi:energy-coupling factor transport system permease protein